MNLQFHENKPFVAGTGQAWMFDIDYLIDSLNYSRVSSTNLTAGSQSTPTSVVPIVDEAKTQTDGTKFDLAKTNADNLDELAELQALQRQEQVGTDEADHLRLAFLSLHPILGVGSAPIGSSISAGSTPPVSAGRPTGSTGRHVSAGRPSGSADRTLVTDGRILGKFTASASSERFPRASSVENSDIHNGLKIFDCPKSSIFTSSSYVRSYLALMQITWRAPWMFVLPSPKGSIIFILLLKYLALADPDWVEAMQAEMQQFRNQKEKYVADILKKFDLDNSKLTSAPFEPQKIREKNVPDEPISVHLYRSMIGCLMYLTATRPDIMFAVCAAARHQVTPKTSNLCSVKRIFKYLTAYPKFGLWYPRDSPFDLEAFSDNDYAGAHGDRKSTTGGCQFLRRRLISWQCKKQTIVATSSCEAEYVAVA
uniref:Uncharacterized protein n=1 Tax=Tanacetum cinerariifolium TaxID=118510 RepID=A0A699KIU1_TANCI|nr:hypothetical protein [Tanacetum cinerariifolium]